MGKVFRMITVDEGLRIPIPLDADINKYLHDRFGWLAVQYTIDEGKYALKKNGEWKNEEEE